MAVKQYFAKSSPHFTNADAQVIGPVLGALAERGPVTARDVLETAHSTNSPLHKYFEWDDAKAAEMQRLGVAREMVKTVRVRVVTSAGISRGHAAQAVLVQSPTQLRPIFAAPVSTRESVNVQDKANSDRLMERSLDVKYYPDDIDEASDIIDVLREMLTAFTGAGEDDGADLGMTGKEAKLYRYLKARTGQISSKQQILTAIYGVADDMPEIKIVDVFVCKLRKKMPQGEEIETVWGQGYRWTRSVEAEDGSRRRFTDHAELDPENVRGLPADNPAVLEGRTLFPSTVIDPKDSPALLISGANSRKLGDRVTKGPWSGFPIYQLSLEERATCPESCHHWTTCYGNGMQLARRHKNNENLIPYLRAELTDLQDEFPLGFVVRLHVLGDFYSVEYVQAWQDFLDEFPALRIFGYTAWPKDSQIGKLTYKSTQERWERFAIRFSSEEPQAQGATTIWRMPEDDNVREGIVCPAQTGKTDCCGSCGLCWAVSAKETPIVFIAHGRTSKPVPVEDRPIRQPTKAQLMGRR